MDWGNVTEGQSADGTASTKAVRAVWRRAQIAFKQRNYDEAVSHLQNLIEKHGPQGASIPEAKLYFVLGVTLLRLRRTDQGVEQLLKSLEADPNSAWAHYKLGLGYGRQGKQEDALRQFLHALSLDPSNPEYLCRLGLQYRRLSLIPEARAAYEAAQEIEPDREEAVLALAELSPAFPTVAEPPHPERSSECGLSHQAG
jgi:tetratricopeptide (TPR) repeat protein